MRALCVLLSITAVAFAAFPPTPDSWELPPAAPNYLYNAQGVLGSGDLSTLVVVRDPLSSNVAYNTSLFAFAASGGLVPLNYLELDGHCASTIVADILVCDYQSSAGGITQFYQLTVTPGSGGANRLSVVEQIAATEEGVFAAVPPIFVNSSMNVVFLASINGEYVVYELTRLNGLGLIERGSISADGVSSPVSIAMDAAGDRLFVSATGGTFVFAYPSLTFISKANVTASSYVYLNGVDASAASVGFAISNGATTAALTYTTLDFSKSQPTASGPTTTDKNSAYFSSGLTVASASTNAVQGSGPCVYVGAYSATQSKAVYATLSQISVPDSTSEAVTVTAQTTLPAAIGNTLVANDNYVFVIYQEIMYRWKMTC